jgi:hypothetical protein
MTILALPHLARRTGRINMSSKRVERIIRSVFPSASNVQLQPGV